jgi:hypothetical protein
MKWRGQEGDHQLGRVVQWTGGFFAEWCEGRGLEVFMAGARVGQGGKFGGGRVSAAWRQGMLSFWIHHKSIDIYLYLCN